MANTTVSSSSDLKNTISKFLRQWKLILASIFFFIALAALYLRYATPKYEATAKVQILDEKGSGSELNLFQDLEVFSGGKRKVEDEIEILKSRSNLIEVVNKLNLNRKIFAMGNIINSELYERPPININFIASDTTINNADFEFFIKLSSNTTFGYSESVDAPIKVHPYGKNLQTPIGDIVITPNIENNFEKYQGDRLKIKVEPLAVVAQAYQKRIMVNLADDFSNIVNISLKDPIKEKAINILDELINTYNENAIEDKKIIADRTARFINERIADIASNLSDVDETAETFKSKEGVTDIQSEANVNLNVGVANQQELANMRTQLNIAASMQDIIEQQEGFDVLPANIGLSDPTIASATSKYNELVLERNRLLKSSNEKNPVIVNLDQQLSSLRSTLNSSLSSTVNNLSMRVNTLSGQQAIFNSKIYSAPRKERALRDITRRQQTTESLYLYLLQKREEAQIAVASTNPKSKVIDAAYSVSNGPVSPKTKLVFLASIILGFLVPVSFIYVKDLIDDKIHNMAGLEKFSQDVPVLGEIPKLNSKENKLVADNDRSVLSESLRIIRTNLDYLLKSKHSDAKNNIVFVTSSVPGEGKTFVSSNLAKTIATAGKKVILVGGDIRNPKLYDFYEVSAGGSSKKKRKTGLGLTDYLYDYNVSMESIIETSEISNRPIDLIYSGKIPPNPAELLMSDRLPELLDKLSSEYDYVIVDTAPLMVVSDTLLINQYSDYLVYVTRAEVTSTEAINYPLKLKSEGKIKELAFIVNGVKSSNLGYGGKYGYGYGQQHKKWWNL